MVQNTQGPPVKSSVPKKEKNWKRKTIMKKCSCPSHIKHTFIYPVVIHFVSFHSAHLSSPNYSSPASAFHAHWEQATKLVPPSEKTSIFSADALPTSATDTPLGSWLLPVSTLGVTVLLAVVSCSPNWPQTQAPPASASFQVLAYSVCQHIRQEEGL